VEQSGASINYGQDFLRVVTVGNGVPRIKKKQISVLESVIIKWKRNLMKNKVDICRNCR
jgi:hypothetical protein